MRIDVELCRNTDGSGFAPNDGCDYDEDEMFSAYAAEVECQMETEYPDAAISVEARSSGSGKIYVFEAEDEDDVTAGVMVILDDAYQSIDWDQYVYTYKIWIVKDRGQPDGINGLRLESPGDNDLGHEVQAAQEAFYNACESLRELGDDWANASFALTRERGDGYDIEVIGQNEYEEEEEEEEEEIEV